MIDWRGWRCGAGCGVGCGVRCGVGFGGGSAECTRRVERPRYRRHAYQVEEGEWGGLRCECVLRRVRPHPSSYIQSLACPFLTVSHRFAARNQTEPTPTHTCPHLNSISYAPTQPLPRPAPIQLSTPFSTPTSTASRASCPPTSSPSPRSIESSESLRDSATRHQLQHLPLPHGR